VVHHHTIEESGIIPVEDGGACLGAMGAYVLQLLLEVIKHRRLDGIAIPVATFIGLGIAVCNQLVDEAATMRRDWASVIFPNLDWFHFDFSLVTPGNLFYFQNIKASLRSLT